MLSKVEKLENQCIRNIVDKSLACEQKTAQETYEVVRDNAGVSI